jgi:hypothetical protein
MVMRRQWIVSTALLLMAAVVVRAREHADTPSQTPVRIDCGDRLEHDINCTWASGGVSYTISSHGRLTARAGDTLLGATSLVVPANYVVESISAGSVGSDLLLIYLVTDSEGLGTIVARLDARSLKKRWTLHVREFNPSQTLDGNDLYLAGVGFVSRIDLVTGRFVWKLSGLYGREDFSFNSFEPPILSGPDVIFLEHQSSESQRPNKRITVDRATGKARLDRDRVFNGHDSDAATFNRMLGVDCTHCHVAGDWASDANPTLAVARKMRAMVDVLNRGALKETDGVTCWTCHEGHTRPRRLPAASWQALRDRTFTGALASAADDVKVRMSVYADSLSVTCDFCHVAGDWTAPSKPAFRMVARMEAMFDVFPSYMPATARTQCFMCHKGSRTPRRVRALGTP